MPSGSVPSRPITASPRTPEPTSPGWADIGETSTEEHVGVVSWTAEAAGSPLRRARHARVAPANAGQQPYPAAGLKPVLPIPGPKFPRSRVDLWVLCKQEVGGSSPPSSTDPDFGSPFEPDSGGAPGTQWRESPVRAHGAGRAGALKRPRRRAKAPERHCVGVLEPSEGGRSTRALASKRPSVQGPTPLTERVASLLWPVAAALPSRRSAAPPTPRTRFDARKH